MSIKKIIFISFFLAGQCMYTFSQSVNLFQEFLYSFDNHLASTRDAAMGNAAVANGGTVGEIRTNPSSLGLMSQKLLTEFGLKTPILWDQKSSISFIGAGYRINDKLVVALSRFDYSVKQPRFGISDGTNDLFPSKIKETHYTGTVAYEVKKGLNVGVNGTFLNYNLEQGGSTGSFFADAGVLYTKHLKISPDIVNKEFRVGLSLVNASMGKTKWKFGNGKETDVKLTSHLRVGGAYAVSFSAKKFVYGKSKLVQDDDRVIDLLLQLQWLKFLHMDDNGRPSGGKSAYNWGANAGAELVLLKVLALRCGYRYEKRVGDNTGFGTGGSGNFPYLKGFTFGAGVNIPLFQLTNSKVPFDLAFDYMHRKSFKWLKENNFLSEAPFVHLSLRLNWYLK